MPKEPFKKFEITDATYGRDAASDETDAELSARIRDALHVSYKEDPRFTLEDYMRVKNLNEVTDDVKRPARLPSMKFEMGVNDVTPLVNQLAQRVAEEKENEYLNDTKKNGFFKRFLARAGGSGQREKFFQEAKSAIIQNRNLMATIEAHLIHKSDVVITPGSLGDSEKYLDEVFKAYDQGLVQEHEKGEKIENNEQINQEVASIMMRYAQGEIRTRAEFDREVDVRIVQTYLKGRTFSKGPVAANDQGALYATNLFKYAEEYKSEIQRSIQEAAAEHGAENKEAIAKFVRGTMAVDVQLGRKERDIANRFPDGSKSFVDNVVNRIQSLPILGRLTSPIFAGAATSALANFAVRMGIGVGVRGSSLLAGAPVAAAALMGGGFAGARRSAELRRDRGLEMRREALGKHAGGDRAEKIRSLGYRDEIMQAGEVIAYLQTCNGARLTPEQRTNISQIMAKEKIERTNHIDMFAVDAEEGARNTKLFSLNKIRAELKRIQAEAGNAEIFAEDMRHMEEGTLAAVAKQDDEFKSFKRWETVKAVVGGSVIGIAGGVLMRSVINAGSSLYNDGLSGSMNSLSNWIHSGSEHIVKTFLGGSEITSQIHNITLPDGSHVQLPDHVQFITNDKGMGMLVDNWGLPLSKVFQGHDVGALHAALVHAGIVKVDAVQTVVDHAVVTHHLNNAGIKAYMENRFGHAPGARADYHNNETFKFDGKEQQLELRHRVGKTVLSMKKMLQQMMKHGAKNTDGTHDNKFADLRAAVRGGNLKDVASNFKVHVMGVDIPLDEHGELVIDKSDPLHDILINKAGKLKFAAEAVFRRGGTAGYDTLATGVGHGPGGAIIHAIEDTTTVVKNLNGAGAGWIDPILVTPEWARGAMETPSSEPRPPKGGESGPPNDDSREKKLGLPEGAVIIDTKEDLQRAKKMFKKLGTNTHRVFILSKKYLNQGNKPPEDMVEAFAKMASKEFAGEPGKFTTIRGDIISDDNLKLEVLRAQARHLRSAPRKPLDTLGA